jgi:hypothetical protein
MCSSSSGRKTGFSEKPLRALHMSDMATFRPSDDKRVCMSKSLVSSGDPCFFLFMAFALAVVVARMLLSTGSVFALEMS